MDPIEKKMNLDENEEVDDENEELENVESNFDMFFK